MSVRGLRGSAQPSTVKTVDGIVCHDLTGFSNLTMSLVRQLYQQRLKIADLEPRPVMLMAQDVLTVEFQVQIYASHPDIQKGISRLAIVGSAFMMKHLAAMFLSYHAPNYPVQQFDHIQEAEAWLLESQDVSSLSVGL